MARLLILSFLLLLLVSCRESVTIPVETEFAVFNFTERWYAVIELRLPDMPATERGARFRSPLLPPGAILREPFFGILPASGGCPANLNIRVDLFRRLMEDVPIDLDPGETVEPIPIASIKLESVAACSAGIAPTFLMRLRRSEDAAAVLVLSRGVPDRTDRYAMNEPIWDGLNPVPELAAPEVVSGTILKNFDDPPDGSITVLLRLYVSTDCGGLLECFISPLCNDEGPQALPILDTEEELRDFCMSRPIAFRTVADDGSFSFARPKGAYFVEPFADGMVFRPAVVKVESPIRNIVFVAEKRKEEEGCP